MRTWAIRDIKHGKTFNFTSYDEMRVWVNQETKDHKMNYIEPKQGDYVILESDNWWIYDKGHWRRMTVDEQLEASV